MSDYIQDKDLMKSCEDAILSNLTLVTRAYLVAAKAHDGQLRWNGDAYITHPERVASEVKHLGKNYEAAALLHDVVEDTEVSIAEIESLFNTKVSSAVKALTKPHGQPYWVFIENVVRGGDIAIRVKIADIQDNLRDLNYTTHKTMYTKYKLALMYLEKVNELTGIRH